jgi:hypothetical protein
MISEAFSGGLPRCQSSVSASIIIVAMVMLHPPLIVLRLLVPLFPLLFFPLPLSSLPMFPLLILLRLHPLLIPLLIVRRTTADFNPPGPKRNGKRYGRGECCNSKEPFHIDLLRNVTENIRPVLCGSALCPQNLFASLVRPRLLIKESRCDALGSAPWKGPPNAWRFPPCPTWARSPHHSRYGVVLEACSPRGG